MQLFPEAQKQCEMFMWMLYIATWSEIRIKNSSDDW